MLSLRIDLITGSVLCGCAALMCGKSLTSRNHVPFSLGGAAAEHLKKTSP
jgi:hypothetical protein